MYTTIQAAREHRASWADHIPPRDRDRIEWQRGACWPGHQGGATSGM